MIIHNKKIKNFVINLAHRKDRLESFRKRVSDLSFDFEVFNAVDGNKLQPTRQMLQIFDWNDYNYRKGIVGCALSHMKLITMLLEDKDHDYYLITEDDAILTPNFSEKLPILLDNKNEDWDILFLGSLIYPKYQNIYFSKDMNPIMEKMNAKESLAKSMGGTHGYLISKEGGKKLFEFINKNGMVNAIDTMMQRVGDVANVYYSLPNIIFADSESKSDIQNKFDNLFVDPKIRLDNDISKLVALNVSYTLADSPRNNGDYGWWIDKTYISVNKNEWEKIKHLIYIDKFQKFDENQNKTVYSVDDCLIYID